jgi:protein-tyrosine phosphatase
VSEIKRMASFLRQLIAGPRARHADSNLDLCYVTPFLIATSGPSGTYPQRAYRNPLDHLINFLDREHGEEWCIWEFRAEGTGYPDEEVRGKVKHYPFPDHHPPPFGVVPLAMASMRNWLLEGPDKGEGKTGGLGKKSTEGEKKLDCKHAEGRVVVVHCKAGKGRSGIMASSYLISECGWTKEEALARFTERRMRPGFGQGVSIPSQLRYVDYVDRWAKGGKKYTERHIEILEVHAWGLRDGVKVAIEGYVGGGKKINTFHVFKRNERLIIEGGAPGGSGFKDMVLDMANPAPPPKAHTTALDGAVDGKFKKRMENLSDEKKKKSPKASDSAIAQAEAKGKDVDEEQGGTAVIFMPAKPLIVPSSDINIDFERRNRAGYGMTMVTAVAHVWFNPFFEGNGPEKDGKADQEGVFEIEWDKMDGIKGSLRKGTRALDRMAVVWRVHKPKCGEDEGQEINEPGIDSPVPEMEAADWKGGNQEAPGMGKDLGLRTESPATRDVSKASSLKSSKEDEEKEMDEDSVQGVKPSGPDGGEIVDDVDDYVQANDKKRELSTKAPEPTIEDVKDGPDTASNTTSNTSGAAKR